ncbi:hypothetical protein ES703_86524 [subsurface metagenome]
MIIENWILSIIPSLALLSLAQFANRKFGSWLAPSAFFGFYWGVSLLTTLILAPSFGFWPGAAWFILFLGCAFHLGVMIGTNKHRFSSKMHKKSTRYIFYKLRWGKQIVTISALFGLLASYILASRVIHPSSILSDPTIIIQIGRSYAKMRYVYGQGQPLIVSILNAFLYFGSIYAGAWLATRPFKRFRIFCILPLLVGLLQAVLTSARTGTIWLFTLFIAGYLATLVLNHRHINFLTIKRIIIIILILSLFVIHFFLLQVAREDRGFQEYQMKTRVSMLSSPVAFSNWLKEKGSYVRPAWGAKTFGGLFDLLGIAERRQALGWEGSMIIVDGQEFFPNVYTAFRQLIEDFTIVGALIVFVGWGVLIGKAYRAVLNGKTTYLPLLVLFYGTTLGSYLANWLNYNSLLFGWLLFLFSSFKIVPRLLHSSVYGQSPRVR